MDSNQLKKKYKDYKRSARTCIYSTVAGGLLLGSSYVFSIVSPVDLKTAEHRRMKGDISAIDNSINSLRKINYSRLENLHYYDANARSLIRGLHKQTDNYSKELNKLKDIARKEENSFYKKNKDIIKEDEKKSKRDLLHMKFGAGLLGLSGVLWFIARNKRNKFRC
jgi:hypothetical protein